MTSILFFLLSFTFRLYRSNLLEQKEKEKSLLEFGDYSPFIITFFSVKCK